MKRTLALSLALAGLVGVSLVAGCSEEKRDIKNAEHAEHAATQEMLYTCGMHPNLVQHEPGTCPICGMELTPVRGGGAGKGATRAGERRIKYWQAPMDPSYIRNEPGKSPMGMDLVPVYEDEAPGADSDAIAIDPVVAQNMGVRVARARRQTLYRHIRTIGEVEVGEDLVSVVNLRFSGWVEKLYADKTGDPVSEGERLFDIYSPELVAAQEEFLLALRTQGPKSELARSARRKLQLWDLDGADIDKVARDRRVRRAIPIRAPRAGFILSKSIVEGARVEQGHDLYHIGDLSRIWVTAEVYERDAPWVEVGQPAQMELTYEPGRVIDGKVAYVYPTFDRSTRTLRARLEFDNPGYHFKPGMFATVYIEFRRKEDTLVIPTEAILHSGTRQLVFVTREEGRFEPREITTGLVGDRHDTEVVSGLEAGDVVVVSGQFLIDSESQLQEAIRKMLARSGDGRRAAPDASTAGDEQIWSCPMHPEIISHEPGRCPVCGMDLEARAGSAAELRKLREAHAGHDHAAGMHGEDSHVEHGGSASVGEPAP